ncbi:hypothetical protein AB0D45_06845 [Streptomyces sp. NPDC048352]|uniref:hypothetical protein n=1 Tax=Streptomyces sp. NPDC048352 TaxID=3154718 RepID=UPI00344A3819
MDVSGELATVGVAGASALVAAMMSDGWRGVRDWMARLLGHGQAEAEARHVARLDRDREVLLAAPEGEDRSGEVSAAWTVRLQDLADEDQDAGRALLEFVNRWREQNPDAAPKATVVRQSAKAGGKARINQVGGNQTVINPGRS